MRRITLGDPGTKLDVLLLGAHADDIEIGCGGTILRLGYEHALGRVRCIVLSGSGRREDEARRSAERLLRGADASSVTVEAFRDGYLPFVGEALKETFERLKDEQVPDIIFSPRGDDLHQDHRIVAELTRQTFRDHLILEYEVPKYDGDLRTTNVFAEVSALIAAEKCSLLREEYPSQGDRQWFNDNTFLALMRLRGVECRAASGYAEGFHCRKLVL